MVRWPRTGGLRRFLVREATFLLLEPLLEDFTPDCFTGLETAGLGFELVAGAFEVVLFCGAGLQKKVNLKLETTAKKTRTKFNVFNRRSGKGSCTFKQTP